MDRSVSVIEPSLKHLRLGYYVIGVTLVLLVSSGFSVQDTPDVGEGSAPAEVESAIVMLHWLGSSEEAIASERWLTDSSSAEESLQRIGRAFDSLGFHTLIVHTTVPELLKLNRPAILHLALPYSDSTEEKLIDDYVALLSVPESGRALVFDPGVFAQLTGNVSLARLFRDWSGMALVASVDEIPTTHRRTLDGWQSLGWTIAKWYIAPILPILLATSIRRRRVT